MAFHQNNEISTLVLALAFFFDRSDGVLLKKRWYAWKIWQKNSGWNWRQSIGHPQLLGRDFLFGAPWIFFQYLLRRCHFGSEKSKYYMFIYIYMSWRPFEEVFGCLDDVETLASCNGWAVNVLGEGIGNVPWTCSTPTKNRPRGFGVSRTPQPWKGVSYFGIVCVYKGKIQGKSTYHVFFSCLCFSVSIWSR